MRKYIYHDVHFHGAIERVRYRTTNPQGEPREKYANDYLPCFSDFLPLSGDCWAVCTMGGQRAPEETARLLKEAAEGAGLPFRIFAATGTEDRALGALTPLVEQMKRYPQVFVFSEDPARGNLHYQVAPGETHCYEAVNDYLYTYIPYLFA